MTLDTILENLDRTILGKVALLASFDGDGTAEMIMRQVLLINLEELRRIRDDVAAVIKESR